MPGFRFDRPVGAGADVKELQYIISLQQTSLETRENSTVSSLDIFALLKSRYGLTITHEQAIEAVRSLGGGDTNPPAADERQEMVELISENDPDAEEDGDEVKPLPSRSSMMGQLHKLHSTHQKGFIDHHSMLSLREEITKDLAAQVMQKTKAQRHLAKVDFTDDDDDDIEGAVQPETAAEPDGKSQSIEKNSEYTTHKVSFADMESGEGPLPEHLDMVQIVSTLLIPKIAKLAQVAATEPKEGTAPAPEEGLERETTAGEETKPADNPNLGAKLANRFKEYGQRKLQINEGGDSSITYSAGKMLDMGKSALLKSLPDTDAPVVDETLIKLLLLSHGEVERANDQQLVDEMVAAATTQSGVLDRAALIQAISSDLKQWDPKCQDTNTPFFYDVFGIPLPSMKTKLKEEDEDEGSSSNGQAKVNGTTNANSSKLNGANPSSSKLVADDDVDDGTRNDDVANSNRKVVDDAQEQVVQEEEPPKKLSIFAKIFKSLFPIIYYAKTEKIEFGTAFLGVDSVLDTSSSSVVEVLSWVWYILTAGVYGTLVILTPKENEGCDTNDYWCVCKNTIVSWSIIAILLILMGFYLILPLSVGNNPADQSPRRQFFAMIMAMVNTILPFVIMEVWADRNMDSIDEEDVKSQIDKLSTTVFAFITLVVGCFLSLVFFLKGLAMVFVDHGHPHRLPRPLRLILEGASWTGESRVYNAAKHKIDKLFLNAVRLHDPEQFQRASGTKMTLSNKLSLSGARDVASRNFILHGETKESAGGMIWTFWQLADGTLYDLEGIWINSRLVTIQITQVILAVVATIGLLITTITVADNAQAYRDEISNDNLPTWVMDIFPTGAMIKSSFIPATFVAMTMLIFLILVYVPSSITTTLKFRAQAISSMDASFQKFRTSVDSTYMNTANAIWGMIGAAILFYLCVGLVLYLFAWPVTRHIMLTITAWGIGLGVTIGIKMVITSACRKSQYRNFYRIKPSAARMSALALECWHIGLAGSILIGRISQFLGAAVFWVGRIDVPFLSEEVVLMGYGFDMVPHHFYKDLLVHEAHRHPYIEQLSQMYLMKLRYGDRFISNAGAAWRQLLVLALFPWLAKHRVFAEERRIMAEVDAEHGEEMEEREKDAFGGVKDMGTGVVGMGTGVGGEVVDVGGEIYGVGADVATAVGNVATKTTVGKMATKGGTTVVKGGSDFAIKGGTAVVKGGTDVVNAALHLATSKESAEKEENEMVDDASCCS